MNRSNFDYDTNLYTLQYNSNRDTVNSPFVERNGRATPIVLLQRRQSSGRQRLSSCCYILVFVISVVLNICLTSYLSIFVYETISNENVTISNIFKGNNGRFVKGKSPLKELDIRTISTCPNKYANSICVGDGELKNFDRTISNKKQSWRCAKNRGDVKFLSMLMKSKEDRLISNRSFYFTKVDVEKLNNSRGRLPLSTNDSHCSGIRYSKDALVNGRSGVFFFYLSLTLNLHEGMAGSDIIYVTVIREDKRGRKTEILKKTLLREIKYFNTFENVFFSETFRLVAKDRIYVVISEADVIWKYSQASWLGLLEI